MKALCPWGHTMIGRGLTVCAIICLLHFGLLSQTLLVSNACGQSIPLGTWLQQIDPIWLEESGVNVNSWIMLEKLCFDSFGIMLEV